MPPTPVAPIAEPRTGDEATQLAGGPGRDDAGALTTPAQAQHRIDADYQALTGPISALVERLGDGAPPWASVSRGYGLMTRAGLDVPAFLALLAEAELLMRPSLPHIEKPMAYLFRVVESLMQQGAPLPRATTRPRISDVSPLRPSPAPQEPADTWGQVRAEIVRELTPENYARWFAPTHQLADADDTLTVAIPAGGAEDPEWHRRWLETKLGPVVARCAERVRPGLRVVFEAQGLRA